MANHNLYEIPLDKFRCWPEQSHPPKTKLLPGSGSPSAAHEVGILTIKEGPGTRQMLSCDDKFRRFREELIPMTGRFEGYLKPEELGSASYKPVTKKEVEKRLRKKEQRRRSRGSSPLHAMSLVNWYLPNPSIFTTPGNTTNSKSFDPTATPNPRDEKERDERYVDCDSSFSIALIDQSNKNNCSQNRARACVSRGIYYNKPTLSAFTTLSTPPLCSTTSNYSTPTFHPSVTGGFHCRPVSASTRIKDPVRWESFYNFPYPEEFLQSAYLNLASASAGVKEFNYDELANKMEVHVERLYRNVKAGAVVGHPSHGLGLGRTKNQGKIKNRSIEKWILLRSALEKFKDVQHKERMRRQVEVAAEGSPDFEYSNIIDKWMDPQTPFRFHTAPSEILMVLNL